MNTIHDVVIRLCASDHSLWCNDEINRHELSRRTDVALAVVSRLFNDRKYRPQKKNLKKLADYFEVTIEQINGDQWIENLREIPLVLKRLEVAPPRQQKNTKKTTTANQSDTFDEFREPVVYVESFDQKGHSMIAINYLIPPRFGAVSLWQYNEYYFYGIKLGPHSFVTVSTLQNEPEPGVDVIAKFEEFEHLGRVVSAELIK